MTPPVEELQRILRSNTVNTAEEDVQRLIKQASTVQTVEDMKCLTRQLTATILRGASANPQQSQAGGAGSSSEAADFADAMAQVRRTLQETKETTPTQKSAAPIAVSRGQPPHTSAATALKEKLRQSQHEKVEQLRKSLQKGASSGESPPLERTVEVSSASAGRIAEQTSHYTSAEVALTDTVQQNSSGSFVLIGSCEAGPLVPPEEEVMVEQSATPWRGEKDNGTVLDQDNRKKDTAVNSRESTVQQESSTEVERTETALQRSPADHPSEWRHVGQEEKCDGEKTLEQRSKVVASSLEDAQEEAFLEERQRRVGAAAAVMVAPLPQGVRSLSVQPESRRHWDKEEEEEDIDLDDEYLIEDDVDDVVPESSNQSSAVPSQQPHGEERTQEQMPPPRKNERRKDSLSIRIPETPSQPPPRQRPRQTARNSHKASDSPTHSPGVSILHGPGMDCIIFYVWCTICGVLCVCGRFWFLKKKSTSASSYMSLCAHRCRGLLCH